MFNLFGGWPAFGWAAVKGGGPRIEDHVGHKVTVARFEAALGDGANKGSQLWKAGFQCRCLSKIHQGSYSDDAFKNHIHEYFLALSCDDGPSGQPGTELSITFLYTFGKANEFNGTGCPPQTQSSSNVIGLNDANIGTTPITSPNINTDANEREFPCYDSLGWKKPIKLGQVDLWTQPIWIEQDGGENIFLQPYYIVKNPARMMKDRTSLGYTLDLCNTDPHGEFCDAANSFGGEWNDAGTPFNGALRAVNFKKVSMYHGGKAQTWCTDAFGRGGYGRPPCANNEIEQFANDFTNGWESKTFAQKTGEVKGAWRTWDSCGNVSTAAGMNGGYKAFGLGFEFVVDNRDPDDDCDGVPDGASLRGKN